MKEEIGIEKLIELLNEYGNEICNHWGDYPTDMDEFTDRDTNWYLSKKFGFIEWLVDNDKIRDDGIKPRKDLVKEITIVDYETGEAIGWKNKYTEEEQLLMYLSIQDEPIEFLISILK